jgi:hypothetical protein
VSWFRRSAESSLAMVQASGIANDAGIIDIGGGASVFTDELLGEGFSRCERARHRGAGLGHQPSPLGHSRERRHRRYPVMDAAAPLSLGTTARSSIF